MDIPHGGHVLVCDGKKALFFRNQGDREYPYLQTLEVKEQSNPASHEQGSDRPGRTHDALGHQSAIKNLDLHQEVEDQFARDLANDLALWAKTHEVRDLILAAPPHMLGVLRKYLEGSVKDLIIADIAKDLTNHPSRDIEDILKAS